MNPRELILLSPYRLPAQSSLMVGNDDVGAFLNGALALWHPAVARAAAGPPRVASPYDHEQPAAGQVFAVPDSPPLFQPDDWDQRVKDAGAVAFRCTLDRKTTLANLLDALRAYGGQAPPASLLDLPPEKVAPFLAVGFGAMHVEALFEAMEHQNVLSASELWGDVQQAILALDNSEDPDAWRRHLQSAADRLLRAREVVYPVAIHLIDLGLFDGSLPPLFGDGQPFNLIAGAAALEKLARDEPEKMAALRARVLAEQAEVCGGSYVEREDALLPVESQLWNLLKGAAVSRDLLGQDVRVFARKRFGFHPQLPLFLQSAGLTRALLLPFDDSVVPSHRGTVVSWPSPDGRQVEAFTRTPYAADSPQTFFHVAHYLHKTIMQDHAATFALLHASTPAGPWYEDWRELSRLAPVLGTWTTLSRYLGEVTSSEYASAALADEFHGDYLSERVSTRSDAVVSGFARHLRLRRRLDTAWTLAALHRALVGKNDTLQVDARLREVETRVETAGATASIAEETDRELADLEKETASALANRLVSRAAGDEPGTLVLNPCGFARRVALELDDVNGPLPVGGPIKAGQFSGTHAKLVVEVPPLGFAWFPRSGPPGTPQPPARMKLADERAVRNEFFEAEIDPATGGLRVLRDQRTRASRMGQQLVYNPGSVMRARKIETTSTGPALGEVISEGVLLDEHERELATFRQRFRAWLGRPILDLRIEIEPTHKPEGYPWHAYYAARFAWGDERATLTRGVNGAGYVTTHTRPESPEWVEIRSGKQSTVLFPGGLPFHQRHGARMLDVILIPEGETARTFDLALGLDREYPAQTALGLATPVPLVATAKGPPHVGATGWLCHLDMPNLMLLGMRPSEEGADAVVAHFLECAGRSTYAEFRCARDPQQATVLDANGAARMTASASGDAALFEIGQNDLAHLRVEFG